MTEPLAFQINDVFGHDPFLMLISCLLSLRTRDVITKPVCMQLFKKVRTPEQLLKMPLAELEKIIYSTGFYHQKARTLKQVSKELIERFHGKVPHTEAELRSIKGIGQKTANLVLGLAFGIPAICVDTHVHRISNLLGLVHTKTPEQTEKALKKILPKKYWIDYNNWCVKLGQNRTIKEIKELIRKHHLKI